MILVAKKAKAKEVEVTNVLNLQDDAVIIYSKNPEVFESVEMNESDASCQIQNDLKQLEIEFSNLQSVELFGVDKTSLSTAQLTLP